MAEPTSFVEKDPKSEALDWDKVIIIRAGTVPQDTPTDSLELYQKSFTVHEANIRNHSPFFDAALRHPWKESKARTTFLPEHRPDAVKLYLGWVYRQRITLPDFGLEDASEIRNLLCRGYVLGDVLLDNDFKDAVIDAVADLSVKAGTYMLSGIGELYENTPEKSPLRSLWVDLLVFGEHESWLADMQEHDPIPKEALLELLSAVSNAKGNHKSSDAPYLNDMCHYHKHREEGVCYKLKYKITGVPNGIFPQRLTSKQKSEQKFKLLLFYRHKLQKGFLSREQSPRAEEMPALHDILLKLETSPDPEASIIRSTKIHKVLEGIVRLTTLPREEEFNFKDRCTALLAKWKTALDVERSISL